MPQTKEQKSEARRRQRAAIKLNEEKDRKIKDLRNEKDRKDRLDAKQSSKPQKPVLGPAAEHKSYAKIVNLSKKYRDFSDDVDTNFEWLKDYIPISGFINKQAWTDSTKKTQFANINSYLSQAEGKDTDDNSKVLDFYREQMKVLQDKINLEKGENQATQREIELHVPWEELRAKRSEIEDSEDSLVYNFFVDNVPRRLQDLFLLKIWTKTDAGLQRASKDFNYVKLDEDGDVEDIILKSYKTAKFYGNFKMELTENFKEKIQEYIEDRGLKHGDLLFKERPQPDQTKMVQGIFSRVVGKPMSVSALRKSAYSHLRKNMSLNQKKDWAKLSGNSVDTLELWYFKKEFE